MSTLPCAITSDSGSLFAVYQSRQQAEAVMNKILGMFPMHASVPGYLLTEVPDEIALRPIPPKALELLRIARDRGHGVRLLQGRTQEVAFTSPSKRARTRTGMPCA